MNVTYKVIIYFLITAIGLVSRKIGFLCMYSVRQSILFFETIVL